MGNAYNVRISEDPILLSSTIFATQCFVKVKPSLTANSVSLGTSVAQISQAHVFQLFAINIQLMEGVKYVLLPIV